MTTSPAPRSSFKAANQTRRAMMLRDHFLSVGADADTVAALPDLGWELAADTIAAVTGRPFHAPARDSETRGITIGLLRGEEAAPSPAVQPAPAVVPDDDLGLVRVGPFKGCRRVSTNISLLVD